MAVKTAKKAATRKKVKVLIADDQTLFREGIKDLLEDEKMVEVIGELDQTARDLGVADYRFGDELKIKSPKPAPPEAAPKSIRASSFAEGLAAVGLDKDLKAGKPIAPRKAYGAALLSLGMVDRRVVALDADVKNSTHAEWFAKQLPDQFFECRIAEQNMAASAMNAPATKLKFIALTKIVGFDGVGVATGSPL